MNNKYTSYNNAIRIKEIPKGDLKKKVATALKKVAMDNSQTTVNEDFTYMVASVTNDLENKYSSLMWGEFLYSLDVGSEGKFGNFYKINANTIKQWIFQYKAERINKMARENRTAHEKIKRCPMSPYMAAAVRIRMDNKALRDYDLKSVAEAIRVLKSENVDTLIKHLEK